MAGKKLLQDGEGDDKKGHEIGEVDAAALKMLHLHLTLSAIESYILC